MAYNDITKMIPTTTLWVQAGAAAGGDGSAGHPFSTIQAAVNAAPPGTAIMVGAGTYLENVKISHKGGGSDAAPLWLLSTDGPGAAHIIAKSPTLPGIQALGSDNVMIDGFKIEGGSNGIQFSQSGSDFTNIVRNVVISNNTILSSRDDGIKVSQADNVQVLNNTVIGAGDQGIDFVAVNDSRIANNDVSDIRGASAIFAKGGSTNVEISSNHVHDVAVDGILLGGWTSEPYYRPDFKSYEAKNITVTGNLVEGVGKRPVNILGAVESEVSGNILKANPTYAYAITVENGSPGWTSTFFSRDVLITDNVFNRTKQLIKINSGNGEGVVFTGNRTDGVGHFDLDSVGPLDAVWSPGVSSFLAQNLSVGVGNGGSATQSSLLAGSSGYLGDNIALNAGLVASAITKSASGLAVMEGPMAVAKVAELGGSSGFGGDVDVGYNWDLNATEFVVKGAWNSVKNVLAESATAANVSIKNFVHADVYLGGTGNSTVAIVDAKRGNIYTGDGNDTIVVSLVTNEGKWDNTFRVASGGGNDSIGFQAGKAQLGATITDGRHTTVVIDAGAGHDQIDLSGLNLKLAQISGGTGNDIMAGSNGQDVYVYNGIAGGSGSDLITNFEVGKDHLQLNDGLGVALFAADIDGHLQVKLTDSTVITLLGVGIEQAGLLIV
jgi:parallel beta-helix repeat protein